LTRKQNKPSFNRPLFFILVIFVFFLLTVCFTYALKYDGAFRVYLNLVFIFSIVFLFPFRNRLYRCKAETDLQKQDLLEKANLLEADIATDKIIVESLRKKIINYSQLKRLTERLSLCLTSQETSSVLSEEVTKLFGDEEITVILYLFHSQTGELGISASQKGQMQVNIKAKKGDVFDHWVVRTLQPLLVEDAKNDYRFDADKVHFEEIRQIRSLISAPLVIDDRALGILRVDSRAVSYFDTEDLRFLSTIAHLGAIATENAKLYERLEELAIKDSLTGLYLRRYLVERMDQEIALQMRRKKDLSFLMIDLDEFKQYNDKFGHMAGDLALKTVAEVLSASFQNPGEMIARYGGEEFSVLLPDCSKKKAEALAQDLKDKIAHQAIAFRREKTNVTVSIGVATFPKDAMGREELIDRADNALYEAKKKGRNKVCSA